MTSTWTHLAIDARRFDFNLRLKGLQLVGHILAIQFGINVNAVNRLRLVGTVSIAPSFSWCSPAAHVAAHRGTPAAMVGGQTHIL